MAVVMDLVVLLPSYLTSEHLKFNAYVHQISHFLVSDTIQCLYVIVREFLRGPWHLSDLAAN